MAIKLIIDKLEDVEEQHRQFYVEKDGKFHLDVDGAPGMTQAELQAAVAAATKKANKEAADLRHKFKPWETIGKTPEEIQAMLAEYDELLELKTQREMTEAEKKGQWEQLRTQMNEKHAKELAAKDKLVAEEIAKQGSLRKSIERHLIDSTALAAIAHHKGIPELLLPYVTQRLKVEEEEGQFNIKVVDAKGEAVVNGKGEPLSPTEFVGEMQSNEVFGRAFQGSGNSGGGTRPGNGGGPGGHPSIQRRSDLKNEKDRAEFIDKHGITAYSSLPM